MIGCEFRGPITSLSSLCCAPQQIAEACSVAEAPVHAVRLHPPRRNIFPPFHESDGADFGILVIDVGGEACKSVVHARAREAQDVWGLGFHS